MVPGGRSASFPFCCGCARIHARTNACIHSTSRQGCDAETETETETEGESLKTESLQRESAETESAETERPETESPETDEPTETETEDEAMPRCCDDVQTRPPSLHRAIARRKPPAPHPTPARGLPAPQTTMTMR